MIKEYCLNMKIARFEVFIIPFRFLWGKTSVMDVTFCRYGRDMSEIQMAMVWENTNQTFTALWLIPTMILTSSFDVKKTIWNGYEYFMLMGYNSGHNNKWALMGGQIWMACGTTLWVNTDQICINLTGRVYHGLSNKTYIFGVEVTHQMVPQVILTWLPIDFHSFFKTRTIRH